MQISVAKTMAWVLGGGESHTSTCVDQSLEQVSDFKYLGASFSRVET